MLIHLGSDHIQFIGPHGSQHISRHDVEHSFSSTFVALMKQYQPDTIFIINGPGSFTNLRVGCLGINSRNMLASTDHTPKLCSINKLDWYRTLYQHDIIPATGFIFIGQKRLIRQYDCVSGTTHSVEKSSLTTISTSYFIDQTFSEQGGLEPYEHNAIQLQSFSSGAITFSYQGETHNLTTDVCKWNHAEPLEPTYMIEPNIGH